MNATTRQGRQPREVGGVTWNDTRAPEAGVVHWLCALLIALVLASCSSGSKSSSDSTSAPGDGPRSLIARDLGSGRCVAVNLAGQVVGVDVDDSTFVVSTQGVRTALAPPHSDEMATGVGIDNDGRVVGYVTSTNGEYAAEYRDGAWLPLAAFGVRSRH